MLSVVKPLNIVTARRFPSVDPGTLGDIIGGSAAGSIGGVGAAAGGILGATPIGVGNSAGGDHVLGREVVIEIKGQILSPLFWPSMFFVNEPEWIKNVLEARGWKINRSVEISSGLAGVGQRTWRVTASVGNQYSDSQIVNNARNHLMERKMSVASVNIVRASPASYVQGVNASSGGDGSNVGLNVNSMIAGAAVGLGVSSTVLLAGGAVVLVLLLRRR